MYRIEKGQTRERRTHVEGLRRGTWRYSPVASADHHVSENPLHFTVHRLYVYFSVHEYGPSRQSRNECGKHKRTITIQVPLSQKAKATILVTQVMLSNKF